MRGLVFNTTFPIQWIAILAILGFCVLAWFEVKRNQKLLLVRLCALLLAIISLACLILNPSYSIKKSSTIILLTPEFAEQTLDSLRIVHPESQLYKLKGVTGNNRAIEIENYRTLNELQGNLMVLGEGVPPYMLEYMDTTSLQFFPARIPSGIVGIDQTKIYSANQENELSGSVNANGINILKLSGSAISEDSIVLQGDAIKSFSLKFSPKISGLYTYTLTSLDSSGKVMHTEHVPVQVKEQKSLSILFLSDYPTAEIRFLKNFLENQGHKLTLRYKISKDKYRTEFVNTQEKSIGINDKLLQNFDLVLTDVSSITSLSKTEISKLTEAMKSGLGILTIINTEVVPSQAKNLLDLSFSRIKKDSATLLVNQHWIKIPAIPVQVTSERKLFRIQQESSGRIISGYYSYGLGKLGFQVLTNTFSLQLAGEKETYAALWSELIESVSRREIRTYDLRYTTPFPYYQDEPVEFKIIAAGEKPIIKMDSAEIQLMEDPFIKNVWYGKIWAGQPGWSALQIDQDSSQYNFFVSKPEEWKSLRVANQQEKLITLATRKNNSTQQVVNRPIAKIIFFISFLLAVGFLWLAPKL